MGTLTGLDSGAQGVWGQSRLASTWPRGGGAGDGGACRGQGHPFLQLWAFQGGVRHGGQ